MEAHAGEKRARDELPVTMGQVVVVEDDVKPVVKRPRIQTEDLYDPWMPTDETVVEEQAEPSEPLGLPDPPLNTFASELMQASREALTLIEIDDDEDDDDEPVLVVSSSPRANARGFKLPEVSILERGTLESFPRNSSRNRVNSCLAVYKPIWSSELWRWATNARRYARVLHVSAFLVFQNLTDTDLANLLLQPKWDGEIANELDTEKEDRHVRWNVPPYRRGIGGAGTRWGSRRIGLDHGACLFQSRRVPAVLHVPSDRHVSRMCPFVKQCNLDNFSFSSSKSSTVVGMVCRRNER